MPQRILFAVVTGFYLLQLALLKEPAAKTSFEMVLVIFAPKRLLKTFGFANIFAQENVNAPAGENDDPQIQGCIYGNASRADS
jgi:hypothetical protein